MCDPVSITIAAVTAASTAFAGYTKVQGAKYAAAVAGRNAELEDRRAVDAENRSVKAQMNHYRRVAALKSEAIAASAANGLDVTFGAPLAATEGIAVEGEADAQTLRENFAREAEGYRISAWNHRAEEKAQKRAATHAMISTALDLGATALGAAKQFGGGKPAPTAQTAGNRGGATTNRRPGASWADTSWGG